MDIRKEMMWEAGISEDRVRLVINRYGQAKELPLSEAEDALSRKIPYIIPDDPKTIELLTRPDVDSTALLTEPTLDAWGIPFQRCAGDDDPADAVRSVVRAAEADQHPIALIMERSLA